jgi:hypothetical protein
MIRVVRQNGVASNDDMVVINRMGDRFSLKYTYGDTTRKTPFYLMLDDRSLLKWVRVLFRLLENDSEPFASVQFDFPIMPSIIVNVSALDKAYNTILDAMEFHMDNWPTDQPPYTPYSPREEEDEEVPPLIPISPPAGEWNRHLFL